jgi:hypothetical protein
MSNTTINLPGSQCKTALTVEQCVTDDVIRLVFRSPAGAEVADVVLKWQNGMLYLDGWSEDDIFEKAEVPAVERTLYGEEAA